jgi:hypothetical protein
MGRPTQILTGTCRGKWERSLIWRLLRSKGRPSGTSARQRDDERAGRMALAEISNLLWSERQLLELLSFKLEEEQLLLASGRSRWLAHATREVEMVLDEIKNAELARAIQLSNVAAELGLGTQPSLRELAESVDEPWKTIFEQHRLAFLTAVHDIQMTAQLNRDLLSRGQRATQEALAWLSERSGETEIYSPAGVAQATRNSHHFINEAL